MVETVILLSRDNLQSSRNQCLTSRCDIPEVLSIIVIQLRSPVMPKDNQQISYDAIDVEKNPPIVVSQPLVTASGEFESCSRTKTFWTYLTKGVENRDIVRVPPEERQPASWMGDFQMILIWFSANISINNLAVGLCGPPIYNLGFLDSSLCAIFGGSLGALTTAYMSTWGAASGNRTMVSLHSSQGKGMILSFCLRLWSGTSWVITQQSCVPYSISFSCSDTAQLIASSAVKCSPPYRVEA